MERRLVRVTGVVQGVGFRPFVLARAHEYGLAGFVCNEADGIRVEVEGTGVEIEAFLEALAGHPPAGSRVASIRVEAVPPTGDAGFAIEASREAGSAPAFVPADVATCPACVAELFDPDARRFRYPFLSCAECGPRFTVIGSLPYDRERTTMSRFPICRECRREYEDPADRRFHAQTIACQACGPRLTLRDANGSAAAADPLAAAVAALRAGRVVAVKGLGGYHLACDARNGKAVAELRRRKHRDDKPFAVMVADVPAAERLCEICRFEVVTLSSPRRPIVLLNGRAGGELAAGIAPGQSLLGLMLPYTPLHHLLLRDVGGPLVMTSGNRSDEPIAFEGADAVRRLAGIADLFLTHDRPIRTRCDDSVVRVVAGVELPIRRSRGETPVPLPVPCARQVLSIGGDLKSAFAFGRDGRAILSHHLGDLAGYEAYAAFAAAVAEYQRLFHFRPEVIAHDLHPDYASTRYAGERAEDLGVPLVAVQHHHAHLVACLAENGVAGPAIGVTFDGTGYGTDGTIWGGEFLVGDARGFQRFAHLRPVPMPGGDRAAREPWRMAAAHLVDAGEDVGLLTGQVDRRDLQVVCTMIDRRLNAPLTSSAGRLFDAVAALVGLRAAANFEGQAAMELEAIAAGTAPAGAYPFGSNSPEIDTRPLIAAVAADVRRDVLPAFIARRFHTTVVDLIAATCDRIRSETGLSVVALSGGCFQNAILLGESVERLTQDGFRVNRHRLVPPGDGGLCLGQLVVAAAATA